MGQVSVSFSVVIPEYKGAKMIPELVKRVSDCLSQVTDSYEIILVNDSSPDDTWSVISKICETNIHVKGLNLSRNFGQQYAITAGLKYATGEWVYVMDCDLQDKPEDMIKFYNIAKSGFDIVMAKRVVKNVSWSKRFSSVAFHWVLDRLSGNKSDPAIANFGIYHNSVIKTYNEIPQHTRSFCPIILTLGYKITFVDIEQAPRAEGESGYTLKSLLKSAYEVIITRTNRPLRLSVSVGFIMAFISFVLALYNIIAKWVGFINLPGYTTTVFSIWFVGGLLMFMMGILGLYIGQIFEQVKGFPNYIVSETKNI